MDEARWQRYRQLIDRLAQESLDGQGQIAPRRVRAGVWNASATADLLPDQHPINELLARLPTSDRETLARMLSDAFTAGVHTSLVVLHEDALPPFDDAYEGTPYHDYVGRLNAWAWPDELVPRAQEPASTDAR
jgi:hypothetical protein